MISRSIALKKITLAAGEERQMNVSGKYLRVKESSGMVQVATDAGDFFDMENGIAFGDEIHEPFKLLMLKNPDAGTAITLQFYVSNVPITDSRLNTAIAASVAVTTSGKNAPTYTKGTTAALGSGATQAFAGLNGTNVRKSFSVFNTHTTDDLNVRGANGILMHVVAPRTGFVVESGGSITLHVPGALAITYAVCEVFYS